MRRHGHARVDPRSPRAFATCDRCGLLYNHADLHWQSDWRGRNIQNLRLLVCDTCLDVPQEQLRVIVLPPDPLPILNARPELADMEGTEPPESPEAEEFKLRGASGAYGITGRAATLRVTYKVALASGAYGLSGDAGALDYYPPTGAGSAFSSGFSSGFGISIEPYPAGSYGITGSSATLRLTSPLSLASGAYGLTGHTANLTLTLGGTGTIAGATGTFALSGHALTPLTTRKLPEATGSFALTGSTATLIRSYVLSGNSGAYALTGHTAPTIITRKLAATSGAYALTGSTASLVGVATTWNPADKDSSITLTNSNLTATLSSAVNDRVVRGTTTHADHRYFELTIVAINKSSGSGTIIGWADTTQSLTDWLGHDSTNAIGLADFGTMFGTGGNTPFGIIATGEPTFDVGDVMGMELLVGSAKIYKNNVLAVTFSSLPPSAVYPAISFGDQSDSVTANFGASAFTYTPPSGATAWNG